MRAGRDLIPGGRAAGRSPREFDPQQLRIGCGVEMEHTTDRRIACEIAMDHLVEDPRYYQKLRAVHLDGAGSLAVPLLIGGAALALGFVGAALFARRVAALI